MRLLYSTVGLVAAVATMSNAHTSFTTLFINDVNQGDGTCVRQARDPQTSTNPVEDLSSNDMACGRDGLTAVAFTCPAPAGAKLTFTFRENPDGSTPGAIDKSHKGPCAVYLKRVDSMASTSAAGAGWFKIWDEGFDAAAGKWCTEKLVEARGLLSVSLPTGLEGGNYLVRPELLALHQAQDGSDPQFYVGCAQIFIQGDSLKSAAVPSTLDVSIPGHVKKGDASVSFDVEQPRFPYVPPGPAVFVPSSKDISTSSLSATNGTFTLKRPARQAEGGVPAGCLLKNANWCGVEVAAYADEAGCWRAGDECAAQEDACYKEAPPSGNANCRVWGESKCAVIQAACRAGRFSGPPDAGKKLVEVFVAVPGTIPPATNAVGVTQGEGVAPSKASGGATTAAAAASDYAPQSSSQVADTQAEALSQPARPATTGGAGNNAAARPFSTLTSDSPLSTGRPSSAVVEQGGSRSANSLVAASSGAAAPAASGARVPDLASGDGCRSTPAQDAATAQDASSKGEEEGKGLEEKEDEDLNEDEESEDEESEDAESEDEESENGQNDDGKAAAAASRENGGGNGRKQGTESSEQLEEKDEADEDEEDADANEEDGEEEEDDEDGAAGGATAEGSNASGTTTDETTAGDSQACAAEASGVEAEQVETSVDERRVGNQQADDRKGEDKNAENAEDEDEDDEESEDDDAEEAEEDVKADEEGDEASCAADSDSGSDSNDDEDEEEDDEPSSRQSLSNTAAADQQQQAAAATAALTASSSSSSSSSSASSSSSSSSSSSPSSSSAAAATPQTRRVAAVVVPTDGACGISAEGQTCAGSPAGGCCSGAGRCGSSRLHCGGGCQPAFGLCHEASS